MPATLRLLFFLSTQKYRRGVPSPSPDNVIAHVFESFGVMITVVMVAAAPK